VCYCDCDDDPPSVMRDENHKARKEHKCSECGRTIAIGEIYRHIWGVWNGDSHTFWWCSHCIAGQQAAAALTDCDCYCFGGLWDQFWEDCRDHKSFALYRLLIGEQRKWRIRRGPRAGQLMPIPLVPQTA
jgi:hypothetical protein